jgi:hypothetical protein
MDATIEPIVWPDRPYRGLDFYRESDSRLFREREQDVRRCREKLLGFGVKILILQGSSGSGKSSFLRAGLLPYLKQDKKHLSFFLNSGDCVIRCTADPLSEIAASLVSALTSKETFANEVECGYDSLIEEVTRCDIRGDVETAIRASREKLGHSLVNALAAICADLPGKLILVLDQVEEALTRTTGSAISDEASAAFFRFLEEVYVRNIDVRILLSLRTEYYGRFRDELRISDDRLSDRPKSGGVEPYLLWPLREKQALVRAIEAPTNVMTKSKDDTLEPLYDFGFEYGLVERLVEDLLQEFPHASVTPALQVICASLFDRLNDRKRIITCDDYKSQGGLSGIIRSYVERGLNAIVAGKGTETEVIKWLSLLNTLVSRQGGGTVVSLTETSEELARRAGELGIRGDIRSALAKLASGPAPLLRGEPPDKPRAFGLKHDVLAVILSRWEAEYEGALEAKKENSAKLRKILGVICAAFIALASGSVAFMYNRNQTLLEEKSKRIELTNSYAKRSPRADFRLSLLLTVANVSATERPNNWYESIYGWLTGGVIPGYDDSLSALRDVFHRSPRFVDGALAAGFDPDGRRLALLRNGLLEVWTLPSPDEAPELSWKRDVYPLSTKVGEQDLKLAPAAGFVANLGPVAFINGRVYYWDRDRKQQDRPIWQTLVRKLGSKAWIRVDFISGDLQATANEIQADRRVSIKVLRLNAVDIQANLTEDSSGGTATPPLISLDVGRPAPIFSTWSGAPEFYGYLDEIPPGLQGASPSKLVFGRVDGQADQNRIRIEASEQSQPKGGRPTIAFVANRHAALSKHDDASFEVVDLTKVRQTNGDTDEVPKQRVAVFPVRTEGRNAPQIAPWQYPPLAGVQISEHIRAAWLGTNGVRLVESSDNEPGRASPLMGGILLSGEPGGTQLQFTTNGQHLVLLQQWEHRGPISVRIWDLRPAWRDWIDQASAKELGKIACRLVRADGDGAFTEEQIEQFQIDRTHKEPCP